MPRGGKREGAGSKSTWKHGKTRTIRVPIALAEEVLELAKKMDKSDISQFLIDADTHSNRLTLDLSGISIFRTRGKSFIFLSDLLKAGYIIKPEVLANRVKEELLGLYGSRKNPTKT